MKFYMFSIAYFSNFFEVVLKCGIPVTCLCLKFIIFSHIGT